MKQPWSKKEEKINKNSAKKVEKAVKMIRKPDKPSKKAGSSYKGSK